MFGREIRRKLPGRVVPLEEKRHNLLREKDKGEKRQTKVYADERRHAQQSSIKIGDRVLLKQNRGDMLIPAYDPWPYAVIGVKGFQTQADFPLPIFQSLKMDYSK